MGSVVSTRRRLVSGFLGRLPYDEAVVLQETLREALYRGEGPECLLLLEHPHVYTLGRNAKSEDVVAGADWLRLRGVEVRTTSRGGQVTYHGPGQLVGYPILNLSPDRRDVRRYVSDLQEVLVRTLADYGMDPEAGADESLIGVWVDGKKVASIGVHLRRWITIHGFALNVTTDLSYFSGIVPCGLQGVSVASMESLTGRRLPLEAVAEACRAHFTAVFDRECAPVSASPGLTQWLGRRQGGGNRRR